MLLLQKAVNRSSPSENSVSPRENYIHQRLLLLELLEAKQQKRKQMDHEVNLEHTLHSLHKLNSCLHVTAIDVQLVTLLIASIRHQSPSDELYIDDVVPAIEKRLK